ncbi:hypothetical protein EJ05DRAFT_502064 [Pseudovirgaria hyperparasitica]|uniref:Uncharacterized protein n=1 Tax=Pseudovirgaria hyperparasitica TaxID=470096 RepID=A0A6A6W3P7_9PEZI|nr:uncharacterized protein EJ05DRAFT_502064 [Pseudovirgaria hyperparasitica]KAF2756560.1 hypothetical protein EJ05DRAFT_502064 [Pseudovirgaria hyperparasitica]
MQSVERLGTLSSLGHQSQRTRRTRASAPKAFVEDAMRYCARRLQGDDLQMGSQFFSAKSTHAKRQTSTGAGSSEHWGLDDHWIERKILRPADKAAFGTRQDLNTRLVGSERMEVTFVVHCWKLESTSATDDSIAHDDDVAVDGNGQRSPSGARARVRPEENEVLYRFVQLPQTRRSTKQGP